MNKNLMKLSVLLAVFGLMTAMPLVYAEEGGPGPGPRGPGYQKGEAPGFFKELNLTEDQKAKLKAHREAQKEKNRALREQLKTKMQALHDEIGQPVTDKAKIDSQVAEINTLKGQLFAQHIDGVLGMKEILTPEQFAKMQEKRPKPMGKKGGWMKHRQQPEKPE